MTIRLSGLISGLDTDSIVQELVSAYNVKKQNYEKEQTKLGWTQEAWKSLNTSVYSFYTGSLSQMRFSTNYSLKSVTVSDSNKATVSAASNAVNGTQTLKINSLAASGYLTGAELGTDKNGNTITASTKISDLSDDFKEGIINVKVDGKTTNITVKEDMNIGQLVSSLKSAGLSANYDENNNRMFIASTTSGKDHDFSLTGNTAGTDILKSLGIFSVSAAEQAQYEAVAGYDAENLALNEYLSTRIAAANKTYSENSTLLTEEKTALQNELTYAQKSSADKASAYKSIQEKIDEVNKNIAEAQAKLNGTYTDPDTGEAVALTDEERDALESKLETYNNNLTEYENTKAMYDRVNTAYGVTITTDTDDEGNITYTASDATISDDEKKEYEADLSGKIQEKTDAISDNTKAIEANNSLLGKKYSTEGILALSFTEYGGNDIIFGDENYENNADYQKIKTKYDDMVANAQSITDTLAAGGTVSGSEGAVRIEGADSEIVLNGAVFKSNTNNYSINGLTITATALTGEDETLTINTTTDIDGIYNNIKSFFTAYNELIKQMDTLYNADSSSGYEPLTDEEKDAMSDTEVEKWETKIKDSLLRRDSTLGSVINAMKTAMSTMYTVGDKKYSLSSFGIATLGYFASPDNETGVYHINGDPDDGNTSGSTDKLKAMLATDPDTVISFFSQLAGGLYDTLTKKMASSTLSSAYTIYNDKQLQSKYNEYDDIIEEWEDKVTDMEDKYYDQFSAMETALATLQSNTSALSSLMGS